MKQARGEARQSGAESASPKGDMTSPADAKVELVARALAKADGKDPDAPAWAEGYGNRERTWGLCWRDQYGDKARAVLAALEASADTPTEAMIKAGASVFRARQDRRNSAEYSAYLIYTAMQAVAPIAPVQDDDAEWLRGFQVRSQRMLQDGDLERFERIANRLSTADHSLVEALETAEARINEAERAMIEERKTQYGSTFNQEQRAAIRETHLQQRIGAKIMAAALGKQSADDRG